MSNKLINDDGSVYDGDLVDDKKNKLFYQVCDIDTNLNNIDKYKDKILQEIITINNHQQYEWLIFDDSKLHFAENPSDTDRLILILDIERPNDSEIAKSKIGDTKELIISINSFTPLKI